jgi:Permeases of the drug/metabolite transporter (DMT) superfamily
MPYSPIVQLDRGTSMRAGALPHRCVSWKRMSSSSTSAVADQDHVAVTAPQSRAANDGALVPILTVVASTAFFAMGDVAAKMLTDTVPAIEVTWLRYVVFCAMVLPTVLLIQGPSAMRTGHVRLQIIRGIGMVCSSVLFILGLRHLSVVSASAINFVSPIFITALSIPMLGEKIGIRRWTAAAVGFAGVVIVVRPGGETFSAAALLPMAAAASWAVAAISTRMMSSERPDTTLAWSALVGLIVLSVFVPFEWHTPTWREIGLAVLMGGFSTICHWLVVLAYRKAEVSTLAPFSYVQLVFAGILGFAVFGSIPDAWTLVGGAIIAASGLYTAHRERVRARGERRRS